MRSSLRQLDLPEQSESLYLLALLYCGLEYTRLVLHYHCVSYELQHARRQRRGLLSELLELLACSAAGFSNTSFSAASWSNRSYQKKKKHIDNCLKK